MTCGPGPVLRRRHLAALVPAAWLAACGARAPFKLGFLGDLSGRGGDFSAPAHAGVLLAIEQRNAAAGPLGEPWELLTQDYGAGVEREAAALHALADAGVRAIIGPYAAAVALRLAPVAAARGVPLVGPTINGHVLASRDDHLICLNMTGDAAARDTAHVLRARGWGQLALAWDERNTAFAMPWARAFRAAFIAAGGTVGDEVAFGAGGDWSFFEVTRRLLGQQPRGLLFVANSVDTARLAQQVAKQARGLPLAATAWAWQPDLIEIGGRAVDGLLLIQPYKLAPAADRLQAFHSAYRSRFQRDPAFSAIASFEATQIVAQALARAQPGESLRDALLRHGPYDGLQDRIALDRFGDAERPGYATVVRNGRFELLS